MPELPEVETIRQELTEAIVGLKITDIEVRLAKQFKGEKKDVVGAKIVKILRRGKVLVFKLSNGKNLVVHLKLTGQLVWVPKAGERTTLGHPIPFAGEELPSKTTHIIFSFDKKGKLFYNDLRQFGWIKVLDDKGVEAELAPLYEAIEPFTPQFTSQNLAEIFSRSRRPIKLVLMDQAKIVGVGNIYANDALWEARIDPRRPANSLEPKEIEKLRQGIVKVLKEGLKYGGASENAYVRATGEPGAYQEHFRAYQMEGEACPRGDGVIRRLKIGGRGTFYCPGCQK